LKILSRAVGTTVLAANTSTQQALESYEDHGLFTYVVAQGLMGKGIPADQSTLTDHAYPVSVISIIEVFVSDPPVKQSKQDFAAPPIRN